VPGGRTRRPHRCPSAAALHCGTGERSMPRRSNSRSWPRRPGLWLRVAHPGRRLGLAGHEAPDSSPRVVDRLAVGRRRHRELPRSLAFIAVDLAVVIAWHTPAAVRAVSDHSWLAPAEAIHPPRFRGRPLARAGAVAPPGARGRVLAPGLLAAWRCGRSGSRLRRGHCRTTTSTRTFSHVAGGLSAASDQQIASAVLWFVSAFGVDAGDLLERAPRG